MTTHEGVARAQWIAALRALVAEETPMDWVKRHDQSATPAPACRGDGGRA